MLAHKSCRSIPFDTSQLNILLLTPASAKHQCARTQPTVHMTQCHSNNRTRLWTRRCSPTEAPECCCGPLFPTSATNRSAVHIKIQGSSSKRQYFCISAQIFIFYFFHSLAGPSLRDFSLREMSQNNLRKIIAVASAGLSGSVNHRRDHHIHSASSFFYCTQ